MEQHDMAEGAQNSTAPSPAHRAGKYAVAVVVMAAMFAGGYMAGSSRTDDGSEDEEEPAPRVDTSTPSTMCTVSELRERLETGEITADMLPASWVGGQVPVDPALVVNLRRLDVTLFEETEQDLRDWTESRGFDIVPAVERCLDDFDPATDLLTR
jgi:hypothetical protein